MSGIVVTAGAITALLVRTDAAAKNIDVALDTCANVKPETKAAWRSFYAGYQTFSDANRDLNPLTLGLPNIGDQAVGYETQIGEWQKVVASHCGTEEPGIPTRPESGFTLDANTKLIAGGALALIVVLVLRR